MLDLEGRPVAGVKVRVTELWAVDAGDLTPFIAAAKLEGTINPSRSKGTLLRTHIHFEPGETTFPPAMTGRDGRFRLAGIGRERDVALRVEGPSVRLTDFDGLTRVMPPFLIPDQPTVNASGQVTYRGANFDLILPP